MNLYIRCLIKATHIFASVKRVLINMFVPAVHVGRRTIIEPNVVLRSQYGGKIFVGEDCYLSVGAQLLTHGGDIKIGNNSTINPYSVIYGSGGVSIGNGVRIAAHCTIVPSNHRFDDPNEYIYKQGLSKRGIVIEDDVWLGSGVKVLDGVTIRRGCVIGANAVVTHSTDEYGVYVGIPAKKIKSRR